MRHIPHLLRPLFLILLGLVLWGWISPPCTAQSSATFTDLGTLSGGSNSMAYAINTSGWVVGWSETTNDSGAIARHAFVWIPPSGNATSASMRDLGVASPTDIESVATGINDDGMVIGTSYDQYGNPRAFTCDASNAAVSQPQMNPVGNLAGGKFTYGAAIDNSGDIVGQTENLSQNYNAFITDVSPGGIPYHFTDLSQSPDTFSGGSYSAASAVNALGHVTGQADTGDGDTHAFIWSSDSNNLFDLGTLYDGSYSASFAISDQDTVVGEADTYIDSIDPTDPTSPASIHAFAWVPSAFSAASGLIDLGTLGGSLDYSAAYGVNHCGYVVGTSYAPYPNSSTGSAYYAFLASARYSSIPPMVDLNNI